MPDIDAGLDAAVVAGQSVALDISNTLTDNDGSETLGECDNFWSCQMDILCPLVHKCHQVFGKFSKLI